MSQRLYTDLTPYYRLVDPRADHEDEALSYLAALERGASPGAETLLDLGAGAGNNASFLKRRFRCTLADLSPAMLDLSRAQNPECAHVEGDLRTLRLGQTFDCVLLHDAICYMLTEDDLRAAAETAWAHLRPGGAALFAPDHVRDDFAEHTSLLESEDGDRSMRGVEWTWDPDPADTTYTVEYAFLFREPGKPVHVAHDTHVEGLFSRATWTSILTSVGFEVELVDRPLDEAGEKDQVFLARRPLSAT